MKKKILIVEDEKSLAETLAKWLDLEGFEVLKAHNGQEGLTVAFSTHPDLILLDILMPVMDGNTMYSKLREDSWGKSVPVIFLSNVTDAQGWASSLSDNDYLVKSSWTLEDVMGVVKKKLGVAPKPISAKDNSFRVSS